MNVYSMQPGERAHCLSIGFDPDKVDAISNGIIRWCANPSNRINIDLLAYAATQNMQGWEWMAKTLYKSMDAMVWLSNIDWKLWDYAFINACLYFYTESRNGGKC